MFNSSIKQDLFIELVPETESENNGDGLPRSRDRYFAAYDNFVIWKNNQNAHSFSEDVFLAYFNELAKKYKPSTLWSMYSMLKSTVQIKNGININTYSKLIAFLKSQSNGFHSKKSKELSQQDVEKFIKEAPDRQYLVTKVALIFAIAGSCRRQELCSITTKDIEHHGKLFLVKLPNPNNKIPRSFTIHGPFYDIVKKYQALRTPKAKHDRFFQNYQKGKCTSQPIGINKFGCMPKEIALYLGLPDADSYTGHSFRKTSVKLQTDLQLDRSKLKTHIGRVPNTDEDSNVEDLIQIDTEDSMQNETDNSNESDTEDWTQNETEDSNHNTKINTETIDSDTEPPEKKFSPEPIQISSTSYYNLKLPTNDEEMHIFENCPPPTSSQDPISETINNNLTQTVRMPSKTIVYTFENCTFTNCFNN